MESPSSAQQSMPGTPARSIMLPMDGSRHAEAAARYVAHGGTLPAGSRVIVLYVRTGSGRPSLSPEQAMDKAAAVLGDAGIGFELRQVSGEPAEEILHCADALPASEIVMGSRGLGRWAGLVAGSVAMKVAQHAKMPVTVVRSAANPAERSGKGVRDRILLAVDGSQPSLRATEYVCGLKAAGVSVTAELATVVGPIPPGSLQENITPEKLQTYYRQEGERSLLAARVLLENAGVPASRHIEAGFIMDRLLHVASATGCSRLVLGTRGRSGLADLLLGSIAYQALHLSPIPVTLVK